jgi:hypothetical protein
MNKPFNLEEALAGKPVETRDGRKVLEIVLLKTKGTVYPVVVIVEGLGSSPLCYSRSGKYYVGNTLHSDLDLVMKSITVTRYVTVYQNSPNVFSNGNMYDTKELAEQAALTRNSTYVGAFPITFEV